MAGGWGWIGCVLSCADCLAGNHETWNTKGFPNTAENILCNCRMWMVLYVSISEMAESDQKHLGTERIHPGIIRPIQQACRGLGLWVHPEPVIKDLENTRPGLCDREFGRRSPDAGGK